MGQLISIAPLDGAAAEYIPSHMQPWSLKACSCSTGASCSADFGKDPRQAPATR